ncbi:MAG: Jag N-terminal domain-containing protein [Candidatus Aceula meridiana]|nr:Jag N-terminal domain-containing protein [Candidatus Aceula meridiana]
MSKGPKKNPKGLEIDGNTVEEAIQNALKELNVSREDIDVKVVCEEKKGLFGMEGEKPAKIIVTLIK